MKNGVTILQQKNIAGIKKYSNPQLSKYKLKMLIECQTQVVWVIDAVKASTSLLYSAIQLFS